MPGGTPGWVPDPGFVTADGAHVIKTGSTFAASRAAGRYLVFSLTDLYLSDDGRTWRRVDLP